MENRKCDIESLLPRYCEGVANAEEQQRVKAWMRESGEHRKLVEQMQMLYMAADAAGMMQRVDTEQALSDVHRRMSMHRRLGWWIWAQRVAAVLFLPLVGVLLFVLYGKSGADERMMVARTNPGMTTSLVLPDSTVVYLNSASTLCYPSSFEKSKQRKVQLKGEAYFEVTKDQEKPFIVDMPHQSQIEVLGTSFNVDAYEDNPCISATLLEGKVAFSHQDSVMLLSPCQKVVYDSETGMTRVFATTGETEAAWKNGEIIFRNTPLKEALYILEKRYDVKFVLVNPRLQGAFTGTFTYQRLERILEYFKLSSGIRWKYVDGEDINQMKTHIAIY